MRTSTAEYDMLQNLIKAYLKLLQTFVPIDKL